MKQYVRQVLKRLDEMQADFIQLFGIEYKGKETDEMYRKFAISEGIVEFGEALMENDRVGQFDALLDCAYVCTQFEKLFHGHVLTIVSISGHQNFRHMKILSGDFFAIGCPADDLAKDLVDIYGFNTALKGLEIVHSANMNKACKTLKDAITTCYGQQFDCYIEAIGEDFNDKVKIEKWDELKDDDHSNYSWFVVKQSPTAPMPHKVVKPYYWEERHKPEPKLKELLES